MRRLASGLSILHLALGLVIVTVLTGVAIPLFYAQPKITLDHAAILLANDLRYAQNEAAISGESTSIKFDQDGDGYSAQYSSGLPIANPVGGGELVRQYSFDAIFRGVSLEVLSGSTATRFDRHGFATTPIDIRLSYQGDTRLLRMAVGSGLVEISGLETSWEDRGL